MHDSVSNVKIFVCLGVLAFVAWANAMWDVYDEVERVLVEEQP